LDLTLRNTVVTALIGNFFWTCARTIGSGRAAALFLDVFAEGRLGRATSATSWSILTMGLLSAVRLGAVVVLTLQHGNLLPKDLQRIQGRGQAVPVFPGSSTAAGCAG